MFAVPSAPVNNTELLLWEAKKDTEGGTAGHEVQSINSYFLTNDHVAGTMLTAVFLSFLFNFSAIRDRDAVILLIPINVETSGVTNLQKFPLLENGRDVT